MRTATTAVLAACVAAIVGGSAASGCYGATEISVAVTTTVGCSPTLMMTTQIFTGATGTTDFGTAPAAETAECGSSEPRIGTLSVVPSGARDDQFDLEVIGAVGVSASDCRAASLGNGGAPGAVAASSTTGCIVARRRVSFRPHKELTVPVLLSARCIGVPCGADQTCDLGICTSTVDCTDQGCPRERGDAAAADASVDAPADAPADAPVDAPVIVDASVPPCRTTPDVVISGQAIVGQLVMVGSDFVYVNNTTSMAGTTSEIRRVPRKGPTMAQVVDAPTGQAGASYTAVAAGGPDLAWASQAPGPSTRLVWPKQSAFAAAQSDQVSLAISGQALVGFWREPAAARFEAFVLGGSPPTFTASASAVPGVVPEVLVDDVGDFYGVSGGTALVHYAVGATLAPAEVGRLTTLGGLVTDIAVTQGKVYAAADPARGRGIWRIARAKVNDTYTDPVWISMPASLLPQSMTSDGMFLYYLVGTTLSRADVAVGAGTLGLGLPFGTTGPSADRLQVDASCIYWVEGGTTIMRRLKQ